MLDATQVINRVLTISENSTKVHDAATDKEITFFFN